MFALDLQSVPQEPGVYLFKSDDGTILYVGKAADLRARVASYRPGQVAPRIEAMLDKAADIEFILTATDKEAYLLESNLIKRHHPRYNVRLTDDKRYPYILLSDHAYPRARIVRDTRAKGRLFGPFPDAGAAWRTLRTMQETFRLRTCKELIPGGCLQYQMRLCWAPCITDLEERRRKTKDRELSDTDPIARYQDAAKMAGQFLSGDLDILAKRLSGQMEVAARDERYEVAARLRDRLQAVRTTLERQAVFAGNQTDRDAFLVERDSDAWGGLVVLLRNGRIAGQESYFFRHSLADEPGDVLSEFVRRYYDHLPSVPPEVLVSHPIEDATALAGWLADKRGASVKVRVPVKGDLKKVMDHAKRNARFRLDQRRLRRGETETRAELAAVKKALGLKALPRRIECFDISHLGGTGVVASMSVLIDGVATPRDYRRFKLSQDKNDDFAAMHEVVKRRYQRLRDHGGAAPDLVLIDGGAGQLNAALEALQAIDMAHLALASIAKKEELIHRPGRLRPLRLDAQALHPLVRVRDEAHRFAVTYQRASRKRQLRASALDEIPGLGPAKKRALLAHFGSVDDVLRARPEDLQTVPGIGPALAAAISGSS